MKNIWRIFDKIPFLRLLIPLIFGILIAERIPHDVIQWLWAGSALCVAIAYFASQNKRWNWFFGAAVYLFLITAGITSYQLRVSQVTYNYPQSRALYRGIVQDIPKIKPRSVACEVKVVQPVRKKLMVYFQPNQAASQLLPGDEIVFAAKPQKFKNMGNPDDFDYVRYMKFKGFSASVYLPQSQWMRTGRKTFSPQTEAMRVRAHILEYYKSFEFNPDQYAFLSAVTLGYKADLSDDMKAAFRASGTAHVLAVSGLHVGIIFLIIQSLLFFLGKTGKQYMLKQIITVLFLWIYVFITGWSVSVIRAAIMLTIYCVSIINHRRGFTYNTLATAAFILLIYNPFYLFDVGFQFSFSAVFAILFFQPHLQKLIKPKNKIERYTWDLFTVSLAAQIGVFPLGLYYFGTFPTYFFITNMLIVPLIGLNIYAAIVTSLFSVIGQIHFIFEYLYIAAHRILKALINSVIFIVYYFESLPFSQLKNAHISMVQTILLFIFLLSITFFLRTRQARMLITSHSVLFLLLISFTLSLTKAPTHSLAVFNRHRISEIIYLNNHKKTPFFSNENSIIPHPSKRILRLTNGAYNNKTAPHTLKVDVLILSHDKNFSINNLTRIIQAKTIVLDSSLPPAAAKKMRQACHDNGIEVHDVSENGAYSINF